MEGDPEQTGRKYAAMPFQTIFSGFDPFGNEISKWIRDRGEDFSYGEGAAQYVGLP